MWVDFNTLEYTFSKPPLDTIVFCTCVCIHNGAIPRMRTNNHDRTSLLSLSNPLVEVWPLPLPPPPAPRQEGISLWVSVSFPPRGPSLTRIIGGIVFQFAAVVCYMLLTTEFLIRFALNKPFPGREDTLNGARVTVLDSRTKQMIIGAGLSSLAMFIRYALPSVFSIPGTNGVGEGVSTVPSNCPTAGAAGLSPLNVTLVSCFH